MEFNGWASLLAGIADDSRVPKMLVINPENKDTCPLANSKILFCMDCKFFNPNF
jgi:hypothetical protein